MFFTTNEKGDEAWKAVKDNIWKVKSAFVVVFRVLIKFVDTIRSRWTCFMTADEKDDAKFSGLDAVPQALDGLHFCRRKTKS